MSECVGEFETSDGYSQLSGAGRSPPLSPDHCRSAQNEKESSLGLLSFKVNLFSLLLSHPARRNPRVSSH